MRSDLDPTQSTAFGIADNRTAELADWDDEVLRSLLDSMDEGLRGVLAFNQKEINALIDKDFESGETKEVDPESFQFAHKCPKCGFEFDD